MDNAETQLLAAPYDGAGLGGGGSDQSTPVSKVDPPKPDKTEPMEVPPMEEVQPPNPVEEVPPMEEVQPPNPVEEVPPMDEEPINPDVEKVYPPEVVASGVDPREDPLARNWKIPQVYSVGTTGVVVKSPPVVDDTPRAVATTKFVSPSEQNGMAANDDEDDEDDEEEVEDRKPAKRKPRAKGKAKAKAKAKANAKRKSSAGSVGKQKTKRSDEEPAPKKKPRNRTKSLLVGVGNLLRREVWPKGMLGLGGMAPTSWVTWRSRRKDSARAHPLTTLRRKRLFMQV